jgi:hypothetical protein
MARVDDVLQRNVGNPDIRREFAAIREDLSRAGNNAEKVASVLDGMKSRIANQDNKFIKGELDKVKADIVSALPGMKEANAKFAEMSEPINQMQVGQALRSKLAGPRGEERSAQFSSAVREAPDIIKRSTGQTRFHSIDDVLTPQQAKVVSAINKELRRDAEAARMASETDTSGALHRGVPTAPALFDPKITLLNKALKSIGHDMDSKTAIEAQKIIESPAKTAAILTRPKSDPMRRVVEAVLQSTAARGPTINMEGER